MVITPGWLSCSSGEESSQVHGQEHRMGWEKSSTCSEEPPSFPRMTCQIPDIAPAPSRGRGGFELGPSKSPTLGGSPQAGLLTCRSNFNASLFCHVTKKYIVLVD